MNKLLFTITLLLCLLTLYGSTYEDCMAICLANGGGHSHCHFICIKP